MHWLIDGNNLMHLLPEIMWGVSVQGRPAALAALVKPYRDSKGLKLTLVFDGGETQNNTRLSGIPVVYSGPQKSADQVIMERLQKAAPGSVGLVTNDQALSGAASRLGARLLRADALAARLHAGRDVVGNDDAGWNFSTRKKGPSRRLPKNRRNHNMLLDKL